MTLSVDEARRLARQALDIVGSRRVAAGLIGTWATLVSVRAIPRTLGGASAGLDRAMAELSGTWYAFVLAVALLVNLLACVLVSLSRGRALYGLPSTLDASALAQRHAPLFRVAGSLRELAGRLVERGWTVVLDEAAGSFVAVRGRYASLAGTLAHVALAGAVISAILAPPVFAGRVLLLEGQSFTGQPNEYMGGLAGMDPRAQRPRVSLRLDDVDARFFKDTSVPDRMTARVTLRGSDRVRTITGATPLFLSPSSWVAVSEVMHALRYTLRGTPGGAAVVRDARALATLPPGREAAFIVRAGKREVAYRVHVKIDPDAPAEGRAAAPRSFNIAKPRFEVRIGRVLTDESERYVGTWTVRLGQPMDFQGNTLTLDSLGYGAALSVVNVPILPVTAGAAFVGIAALLWRVARPRQECFVAETRAKGRAASVRVAARSDIDPGAARDFTEGLAAALGLKHAEGKAVS